MRRPQAPAPIKLDPNRSTRIVVPFRFLTYVFGGGVEHFTIDQKQARPLRPFDPITPVRATGIRGQLRFWWRATTGVRCTSLEEMRSREEKIWGGTWNNTQALSPGIVSITVDTAGHTPKPVSIFKWVKSKKSGRWNLYPANEKVKPITYGGFPLRPQEYIEGPEDPRTSVWDHSDNTYKLTVDLANPSHQNETLEVILAINAWLTAGGYGGRTTRGFGAVALASDHEHTDGLSDSPEDLCNHLNSLPNTFIQNIPALVGEDARWRFQKKKNSPLEAWQSALQKMQSFRQDKDLGRNPPSSNSKSPAGRSRWPEPDALRYITRQHHPNHNTPLHQARKFPRADFGLPIIFHFKDSDSKRPKNPSADPDNQTLQVGAQTTRFPSPLILRPTADGRAMAVHLANSKPPEQLFLKGADVAVQKSLNEEEVRNATAVQKLLIDPDPISAFLKHFST